MSRLQNLYIKEQTDFIQKIISSHIQAKLIIVDSRNELGNRLALSKWDDDNNRILLPRAISVNEQLSAILQMVATGKTKGLPQFSDLGQKLLVSDSKLFLNYLILHEIAHIKHDWPQNRETECDIWASDRLDIK